MYDIASGNENFDELDSSLESLEAQIDADVEEQFQEMEGLEEDFKKIGSPESLGETVMNVVWEQFVNQIGVVAGEDFIKENRGLTLDIRDSAHIQTTENFEKGKIATHNDRIDYQKRYDDWQSNFEHDEKGNILTHQSRVGREEATLKSGARNPFDVGRPVGSVERGTDMDHTVSAGEIVRDAAANAHLTREEQIKFANSEANLNEMDASQNRSKGDLGMEEWLDNPNRRGQKPNEIFDINEEQDKKYRAKDAEARDEYNRLKKEGENRSIETGKQSQRAEAFRIGGKALRAAIMGLLAELMRNIIQKLIAWFKSTEKNFSTLIDSIKDAIRTFIGNLKRNLLTAGNAVLTSIATAIFGPVISVLKKAWIFLKQGWRSLKDAYNYIKDPKNRGKSFSLLMLEVGKIVIAGLTAGGALVLGEVIEKGLLTIPLFAFNIPLFGTLASIIGIFLGAVISGVIGALALNMIDKAIAKKQKRLNIVQRLEKSNVIIQKQAIQKVVATERLNSAKVRSSKNIENRHNQAKEELQVIANSISRSLQESSDSRKTIEESQNRIERNKDIISKAQDRNEQLHDENQDALNDLFKNLED